MKKCISLIFLFLMLLALIVACDRPSKKYTIQIAGTNTGQLVEVIDYFKNRRDTLKQKAAEYLIVNMASHFSMRSHDIDVFASKIRQSDSIIDVPSLNNFWNKLDKTNNYRKEYDASVLTADFLIHNINKAFEIWEKTPWRGEVDFNMFCQYILPYRFQDEMLTKYWRDSLYKAYYPLIANTQDLKEAFTIIHDSILHQMGRGGFSFPYLLNVLDIKKQKRATCMQRCVFLGSVLRSVGIPVAIDVVNLWANYSLSGHGWVSLVTKDGTYSISNKDSVARLHNTIDASIFPVKFKMDASYPLDYKFKKRAAKVSRITYKYHPIPKEQLSNSELIGLYNPFQEDVSAHYNLTKIINVDIPLHSNGAYLCTFLTGKDWVPIAYSKSVDGTCAFYNVGDSIAYLIAVYSNNELTPIEPPFLLLNGVKRYLKPNNLYKRQIIATRKYPLIGGFINNWGQIIGAKFEGSNRADFKSKDVLYTVTSMPVFQNELFLNKSKKYRFIRYVSPFGCVTPISEVQYWSADTLLVGSHNGLNADGVELCFDNNTFTMLKQPKREYMIVTDFGNPTLVEKIIFYPKNDGNFVVPNDEYELFYFDKTWISLGKQVAKDFHLVYDNVPDSALLLLKNKTGGHEERIFTYENGKQIWW